MEVEIVRGQAYRIGTTMRAGMAFGPPTVAAVVEAAIPYRNGSST
jgi:hypothetical protein